MLGADTNEVLECLASLIVVSAASSKTIDNVLGELGLNTVALGVSVVLAARGGDLEPRVHALGNRVGDVHRRVAGAGWLRRRAGSGKRSAGAAGDSGRDDGRRLVARLAITASRSSRALNCGGDNGR